MIDAVIAATATADNEIEIIVLVLCMLYYYLAVAVELYRYGVWGIDLLFALGDAIIWTYYITHRYGCRINTHHHHHHQTHAACFIYLFNLSHATECRSTHMYPKFTIKSSI